MEGRARADPAYRRPRPRAAGYIAWEAGRFPHSPLSRGEVWTVREHFSRHLPYHLNCSGVGERVVVKEPVIIQWLYSAITASGDFEFLICSSQKWMVSSGAKATLYIIDVRRLGQS